MRRATTLATVTFVTVLPLSRATVFANVKPHGLFTDNMVLQQEMKVPVWGKADPGEKVTVSVGGRQASTTADNSGSWMVRLDALKAGGPLDLVIRGHNTVTLRNVLVGEVWICSGQSNMGMTVNRTANASETIARSANPMIRLFTVANVTSDAPTAELKSKGPWVECDPRSVPGFTAVGYFFGRDLQAALKVPVGLINTSWGGTPAESWTDRQTLESSPQLKVCIDQWNRYIAQEYPKAVKAYEGKLAKWRQAAAQAKQEGKRAPTKPRSPAGPDSPRRPSCLYNAMIHPLLAFAIRGAIWYQGEANAPRAYQYRTLLPAMIRDWRRVWDEGDFPFLIVQLAPYQRNVPAGVWPELREAQLLTAQTVPDTALAVITDVGDRDDIHPKRKAPVGARLALAARAIAYGEKIAYSGPEYSGMKVEGDRVVLSFKHVGSGLMAKDGELKGFTIAGKDRKFVPAKAEIRGDKVVVSSPEVPQPVAVRYGWANYPEVNLFNKEGLPATPFRTDDFPMITRR